MTRTTPDRPAGLPPVFPAGPATSPATSWPRDVAPAPPNPPGGAGQTTAPVANPPATGAGHTPAAGANAAAREGRPGLPRPAAGIHPLAKAMSEDRGPDSLDAHVRRLMKDLGLRWYHTFDSRRSPSGFPDLVITGSRVLFRELKKETGKVTTAQQEWLDALTATGEDADVWRPSDLYSGRIGRELAAISRIGRAA